MEAWNSDNNIGLNYLKAGQPYESQWELLRDCLTLLDTRLYLLYKYHAWVGPQNVLQNMLGMVVTREQFEENLARSAQITNYNNLTEEEAEAFKIDNAYVQKRIHASVDLPLLRLQSRYNLADDMLQIVILAFAPELDGKYEKLYAYLQDDIVKTHPSIDFASRLFAPKDTVLAQYREQLLRHKTFGMLFEAGAFSEGELRLHERVIEYLLESEPKLRHGVTNISPEDELAPLSVHNDTVVELCHALSTTDQPCMAVLTGSQGAGKEFIARHALKKLGRTGVMVDLLERTDYRAAIRFAALDCALTNSVLCICHAEAVIEGDEPFALQGLIRILGELPPGLGNMLILGEKSMRGMRAPGGYVVVQIALECTNEGERVKLFSQYGEGIKFTDDVNFEEIAAKFSFGAGQIQKAMAQLRGVLSVEGKEVADVKLVHKCCYEQAVHKLNTLATLVKPGYRWEDLVLPKQQIRLMKEACNHVRFSHKVYEDWGFIRHAGYGRGLSMLFSGPPGTGKTMGAGVIANELQMELYKIQISQVVSKYIGETEKNLREVFNEAKNSNCILFFDECDALFGKRSEVKDAHDRYANVETAYLLQQVEEHEGVTIMATNLMQNIDQAFMRRIGFVVHFPFPDKTARELLFRKLVLGSAPVEENMDYAFLAEKFHVAGGNIKNIVINAAFMAAEASTEISMAHMLRAAVNELKKNEIVVVKEDLCEYADLVFE